MDTNSSPKSSSDGIHENIKPNQTPGSGIDISTVSGASVEISQTDSHIVDWTGLKAVTIPHVSRRRLSHRPLSHPPSSCLIFSIVTVFCALPLGIVAVYFSTQSLKAARNGDYWGARKNSRNAISFIAAGITVGVFITVLLITLAATDSL